MKLNNFFIVFYGLIVLYGSVFSYRTYRDYNAKSSRLETMQLDLQVLQVETYNLNTKVTELKDYIQFMEQSIPDIQKRNAKAKVVKEILNQEIRNTKQNNFKSEREYNDYVLSVVDFSEKFRVPTSLILAVSRTESNFNPRAVSPTNAQGIMQLMPDTTKYCMQMLKKDQHDAFYVRDSVQCGTWYLKQMLDIFKDENLVIQAYNVGPSYILKYKGESLPEETVNYHVRVTALVAEYRPKFKWEN
jgi:soluble lytic murein transglycosylase-like protein